RLLVILYAQEGRSIRETHKALHIGTATVQRIRRNWFRYSCLENPFKQPNGRQRAIQSIAVIHLQLLFEERRDWYLEELQAELRKAVGCDVCLSTVWRCLRSLGITHKQVS
ncbi:hypothetical protein BCR33DRAFT_641773, partial [Rhizoclosmatium globosum]